MDINVHFVSDNQFTGYSSASVTIKGVNYTDNIIVTNNSIFDFASIDIKQITIKDLDRIIEIGPDLVIFGSGNKITYPDFKLFHHLQQKGIGAEVMSIPALCRTFNF